MDGHTKQLAELEAEIGAQMQRAESDFRTGPCSTNAEQINALFRKAFETITSEEKQKMNEQFLKLQSQLDDQSNEIARMKDQQAQAAASVSQQKFGNIEPTDDEYFDQMTREVNETEEMPALAAEEPVVEEMEANDSQQHRQQGTQEVANPPRLFQRVEERGEEEISSDISKSGDDSSEGEMEELERRCHLLERRMDRIHAAFLRFPYRKKEYQSPGIPEDKRCAFCWAKGEHFSESCPNVIHGDERTEMIDEVGLCRMCLELCSMERACPYTNKKCFYCERVRGTPFEEMSDGLDNHHSALCNIPNRKEEAREILNRARRDFKEAKMELELKQKKRQERDEQGPSMPNKRRRHGYPKEEQPKTWRRGSDDKRRP
ncbi:hypothetical protein OSTOST_18127 [Ostertagia ostertagi]